MSIFDKKEKITVDIKASIWEGYPGDLDIDRTMFDAGHHYVWEVPDKFPYNTNDIRIQRIYTDIYPPHRNYPHIPRPIGIKVSFEYQILTEGDYPRNHRIYMDMYLYAAENETLSNRILDDLSRHMKEIIDRIQNTPGGYASMDYIDIEKL